VVGLGTCYVRAQSQRRTTPASAGQDEDFGRPRDQDAARARNSGWSWLAFPQLGRKVERVMGIEPTLLVWDTRKEWPLPGIGRRSLNDCFWPILPVRECPLLEVWSAGREGEGDGAKMKGWGTLPAAARSPQASLRSVCRGQGVAGSGEFADVADGDHAVDAGAVPAIAEMFALDRQ